MIDFLTGDMNVLGIETSCDETSAAIISGGTRVLSSIVLSQIEMHAPYGGVVPEIASRSHVEHLSGVVGEAVKVSGLSWSAIDAVAVTHGPGLASSLLVGLSFAKGLAFSLKKPLCVINHIEAHIYSAFLEGEASRFEDVCPFVALVVSGGHTSLFRVDGKGRYKLLGQTIDDAAGEAFDKGANLLGLGYPGGPVIDRISKNGQRDYVNFPRGRVRAQNLGLMGVDHDLCFSFSGLKTALLYYLKDHPPANEAELASVAASYQEAIIDSLVQRCERAVEDTGVLVVGGGVSLNSRLRERLTEMANRNSVELIMARPRYCGDNAAMIAGLAGAGYGTWGADAMAADAVPNLVLSL